MKDKIEKESWFITLFEGTKGKIMKKLEERKDKSIEKNGWFSNYVQKLIDEDLK